MRLTLIISHTKSICERVVDVFLFPIGLVYKMLNVVWIGLVSPIKVQSKHLSCFLPTWQQERRPCFCFLKRLGTKIIFQKSKYTRIQHQVVVYLYHISQRDLEINFLGMIKSYWPLRDLERNIVSVYLCALCKNAIFSLLILMSCIDWNQMIPQQIFVDNQVKSFWCFWCIAIMY